MRLQVLISTYGRAGIERTAALRLPEVKEAGYLVGWQRGGDRGPVPQELIRLDMIVVESETRGLAVNRNMLLRRAEAPLLKISDDDVELTAGELRDLVQAFDNNPDADILLSRYRSSEGDKPYPRHSFLLQDAPKGYWPSSIEINIRKDRVGLLFDTRFGLNSGHYICGEDDAYIADALRSGLIIRYVPVTVGAHDGLSTGRRLSPLDRRFLLTKAAILRRLHPYSWPLRLGVHILRSLTTSRRKTP